MRLIKGISGSSAGAITAFMLSLGMSSEDIKYEMEREMPLEFPVGNFKGPISVFEQFIDEQPNVFYKRVVDDKPSVGYYPKGKTLESLINKSVWRIFEPLDPIRFTSKTAAYKILKNKFSDNSDYGVTAKLFESKTNFEEILERAILGRGLFGGYKARIYFGNLIKEYLYPQLSGYPLPAKDAGELTFKDFYNLTGVDLVLTGTNITQHAPRYFSVYHTPDFPVIEAVQISMTLPGAFRPVYVNTDVRKGDKKQREKYAGLYVDGGMLNNYPIRAFDNIEIVQDTDSNQNATDVLDDPSKQHINSLTYYGIKSAFPIAGDPRLRNSECNCVLGMRLEELENVKTETEEDKIYPVNEGVFIDFIKSLYKTIGYSSEEGQLRSLEDERRTVKFYASINERNKLFQRLNKKTYNIEDTDKVFTLKVADFSTPAIDKTRGRGSLAKVKDFLIEEAGVRMNDFLES